MDDPNTLLDSEDSEDIAEGCKCYAKANTAGRRFSEGGTHEETLHPQDQRGESRGNKRLRRTGSWRVNKGSMMTGDSEVDERLTTTRD